LRPVFFNRQGVPRPDVSLEAEIRSMDELLSLWNAGEPQKSSGADA
jgi:hypothetical protein